LYIHVTKPDVLTRAWILLLNLEERVFFFFGSTAQIGPRPIFGGGYNGTYN